MFEFEEMVSREHEIDVPILARKTLAKIIISEGIFLSGREGS